MTTRDDIALSTGYFVPCLLPVLPLSWILRWASALSTLSRQSRENPSAAASLLFILGDGEGNFQLNATIYCSQSRGINCIIWETAG